MRQPISPGSVSALPISPLRWRTRLTWATTIAPLLRDEIRRLEAYTRDVADLQMRQTFADARMRVIGDGGG